MLRACLAAVATPVGARGYSLLDQPAGGRAFGHAPDADLPTLVSDSVTGLGVPVRRRRVRPDEFDSVIYGFQLKEWRSVTAAGKVGESAPQAESLGRLEAHPASRPNRRISSRAWPLVAEGVLSGAHRRDADRFARTVADSMNVGATSRRRFRRTTGFQTEKWARPPVEARVEAVPVGGVVGIALTAASAPAPGEGWP
jgi:hypothetical protein